MSGFKFTSADLTTPLVCDLSSKRLRDVQVSIKFNDTFTGGSIAWTMTPAGGNAETVTTNGVAISTIPSDTRSFIIEKAILDSITATPDNIAGAATAYSVTICGIRDSDR